MSVVARQIKSLQSILDNDAPPDNVPRLLDCPKKNMRIFLIEGNFLETERVKWLTESNKNTKFFHQNVKTNHYKPLT